MAKSLAKLTGFSEACYDQNSMDELVSMLETGAPDSADCNQWGLGAYEWRCAIGLALRHKIVDAK